MEQLLVTWTVHIHMTFRCDVQSTCLITHLHAEGSPISHCVFCHDAFGAMAWHVRQLLPLPLSIFLPPISKPACPGSSVYMKVQEVQHAASQSYTYRPAIMTSIFSPSACGWRVRFQNRRVRFELCCAQIHIQNGIVHMTLHATPGAFDIT